MTNTEAEAAFEVWGNSPPSEELRILLAGAKERRLTREEALTLIRLVFFDGYLAHAQQSEVGRYETAEASDINAAYEQGRADAEKKSEAQILGQLGGAIFDVTCTWNLSDYEMIGEEAWSAQLEDTLATELARLIVKASIRHWGRQVSAEPGRIAWSLKVFAANGNVVEALSNKAPANG